MATLERLGRDTGTYIAFLRTDTQLVTKGEVWGSGDYAKGGPKQAPGRNLDYFDAIVFYTNGETEMTPQQKHDLLGFIHDDGKGFVAVHTATASFYSWPEYGDMIGGYFDNHPWNVFDAPVVVERPDFPAMKGWPHELTRTAPHTRVTRWMCSRAWMRASWIFPTRTSNVRTGTSRSRG
jgi:hypothetical protein